MGIRLNLLDNPALRAPVAAGMDPATGAPRPDGDAEGGVLTTAPLVTTEAGGETAPQVETAGTTPQPLLLARMPGEGTPAPEPPETDTAGVLDNVAAPRVRDFRFLAAAQTSREQNLGVERARLEQRLETTYDRLQSTGSAIDRIDARLDRARLEQDLEMIAREIRRMRLARVFARPSVAPEPVPVETQVAEPASAAAPASQTMTASPTPALNLLA